MVIKVVIIHEISISSTIKNKLKYFKKNLRAINILRAISFNTFHFKYLLSFQKLFMFLIFRKRQTEKTVKFAITFLMLFQMTWQAI